MIYDFCTYYTEKNNNMHCYQKRKKTKRMQVVATWAITCKNT